MCTSESTPQVANVAVKNAGVDFHPKSMTVKSAHIPNMRVLASDNNNDVLLIILRYKDVCFSSNLRRGFTSGA